jgi:hypothetical protein
VLRPEIELLEYRAVSDVNGRTINATIIDRGGERIRLWYGPYLLKRFWRVRA